ncbi:hypothetical protein [Amycolatopsis sp. NPDC051071]|uniref:hypothetical protein n=1 Tax=Amycolatopsis sp. NPDC051071 TaxID=3154637 RepID=UPI0034401667
MIYPAELLDNPFLGDFSVAPLPFNSSRTTSSVSSAGVEVCPEVAFPVQGDLVNVVGAPLGHLPIVGIEGMLGSAKQECSRVAENHDYVASHRVGGK